MMPINGKEHGRRWETVSKSDRLSTIASCRKACDHDKYSNLHVLLRICAAVSVTSFECERSGSVLKRLHTYLRASIGQTQLSALALLHVNYDANIDIEKVIDTFAIKKKRALKFANICDINKYSLIYPISLHKMFFYRDNKKHYLLLTNS